MTHRKIPDLLRAAAVFSVALGASLTPTSAQAECVPAPGVFELCALDMMPENPPAPEEDTLVVQLGDLWLDMSALPEDFDAMSQDEILDMLVGMEAESADDGTGSAELSRNSFETDQVSGTTVVMEEPSGDAQVISIATHDTGRLFLLLHGDGSEDVSALEQSMQSVLAALRPRSVN